MITKGVGVWFAGIKPMDNQFLFDSLIILLSPMGLHRARGMLIICARGDDEG